MTTTSHTTAGIGSDPVAYQAKVRPQKLAVRELTTGRALTYRDLDDRIARAAGWLTTKLGDLDGRPIAMLGRNSVELLALAFACQRVGGIFVPLNWRLAGDEIAALIADCTPGLVVVDDEFSGATAAGSGVLRASHGGASFSRFPERCLVRRGVLTAQISQVSPPRSSFCRSGVPNLALAAL